MEFNEVENLSDAQIMELYSNVVESSQADLIARHGLSCNPGDYETANIGCMCNYLNNGKLGYPVELCSIECIHTNPDSSRYVYTVGYYYEGWMNQTYMCGNGVK